MLTDKVKVKLLCCVQLFATPRTVAYQASPSIGFSRQGYWSGLPFPFPPATEVTAQKLGPGHFTPLFKLYL